MGYHDSTKLREYTRGLTALTQEQADTTGQAAGARLLLLFDSFCQQNGIGYFAMEETLVGAVTYGYFMPGDATPKLGMLRQPFQKLKALAHDDGLLLESPEGGTLRLRCEIEQSIRHFLVLEPGRAETAGPHRDGLAAGIGPAPSDECASAELHVFDAITDDFNLTTFQRWREEQWLRARRRAPAALRPAIERHIDAIARQYERTPHDEVALVLERRRRRYPLAHLQQTRRAPFADASISVPVDTRCWVESDAAAEADRVKRVQHDTLLILHEVNRVCRQNGIGYFLCAGTLLGTLRHGGFIPWDDDIDIGMLRPDYERFLQVAPAAIDPRFFVQSRATDPDVEYLFAKVRLRDTEYVTDYTRYRQQEKGISIDVFPFDRAAVESPGFEAYAAEAKRLVAAHRSVARHRVTADYPRRRARNPLEAAGHLIMDIRNRPYNADALARTQRAYEAHVEQFDDDPQADYAVSHVAYLTYIPLADLLPYREARFEDGMFPIPANPDPLMRMQFGENYLQEPPAHLRHAHPVISWRTLDGHSG